MRIVMSVTKGNAPIVGKKQYKSFKDLNGKKVGTPGIGTIHDAVLGYIQQSQGLKFEHVPAKITDVAIMIQKGEVEAFIGWEPASAAGRRAGARTCCTTSSALPPIPNSESLQLAFTPTLRQGEPRDRAEVRARHAARHRVDQGQRQAEDRRAGGQEDERSEVVPVEPRCAGLRRS